MKRVTVGIVGSGFAAEIHARVMQKVYGLFVHIKAVTSPSSRAETFAARFQIPDVYHSLDEMLSDPAIDVIDLCVPPYLNDRFIEKIIRAGKHIICEKPLTGYFGRTGETGLIGKTVPKREMYHFVMEELQNLQELLRTTGTVFCYAENWVYAPAVQRAAAVTQATKPHVVLMRGEEWHSGSHAAHALRWGESGGGALLRQGSHPLGAILYLKRVEAQARNTSIDMDHVIADAGMVMQTLSPGERGHIAADPMDVEDWGMLSLTFTDGSRALVHAGDIMLGGIKNQLSIFTNQNVMQCNIVPNNHMLHYSVSNQETADLYVREKVETKNGWQYVSVEEDYTRGYVGEMQDFMDCILQGRQPLADFQLAYDTTRAVYAAYWAAEEGTKIFLNHGAARY